MSRAIHVFRTPDRFIAGTVGEPGDRSFYLQAVHEARVISVLLEKQQVQVLADRMGLLLEEVHRRFGTEVPPQGPNSTTRAPSSPRSTPSSGSARWAWAGTRTPEPSWWNCSPSAKRSSTSPSFSTTPRTDRTPCVCSSPRCRRGTSRCGPSGSSPPGARRARCAVSRWPPEGHICIRTNGYRRGQSFGLTPEMDEED